MEIRSSDVRLATNIGRTCLMSTTLQSITWRAGPPRHSKPSCHTCLKQKPLGLTPALQQSPLLVKPCVALVCGPTCQVLRCDCSHVKIKSIASCTILHYTDQVHILSTTETNNQHTSGSNLSLSTTPKITINQILNENSMLQNCANESSNQDAP